MFEVRENNLSLVKSWGDVCLSVQNAGRETPTAKERKGARLLWGVTNPYYLSFIYHFIIYFQYLILCKTKWLLYLASILHKHHIMNNVLQFITT